MHSNTSVMGPDDSVIRAKEVSRLTGFSNFHLSRLEKANRFPRRFKLDAMSGTYGAVGWSRREVMAWIAARRESRQAA
jgi:predicted DNA-binding transcriptional regulator AlpA